MLPCVVAQVNKFKTILDNAARADCIVREKFENNTAAMQLLSKSEEEIKAALPAAGVQGAVASGSQVSMCTRVKWLQCRNE